jgi:hypothetical protein
MSLEKVDIRSKVDPVDHALLKGEADALGVDIQVLIRDILERHTAVKRRTFIEAQKVLSAKGLAGELWVEPGRAGKFALSDDDEGEE